MYGNTTIKTNYNMDHVDFKYFELLRDILDNGVAKDTRNGRVRSVFGRVIKHDMSTGFPAITTKKLAVTELLWFLSGSTDIRWLRERGCYIWDGDCYQRYLNSVSALEEPTVNLLAGDRDLNKTVPLTKDEFFDLFDKSPNWADVWADLGPIYGKQWRSWKQGTTRQEKIVNPGIYTKEVDQIQSLIHNLKHDPDSRRLMVSAWNPTELDDAVLPPCHFGFQVYTRKLTAFERENHYARINGLSDEDRHALNYGFGDGEVHVWADDLGLPSRAISLMWNQRSADVPLGLPFNVASYGLLLEILGRMVNMMPEKLIGNVGDAHIYENQVDGVNEQLNRFAHVSPALEISESVIFNGDIDDFLGSCSVDDFKLKDYRHGGVIRFPLSN